MLRAYEVETNNGSFFLLAESPSKAKAMVHEYGWYGVRQDGGNYVDYRAKLFTGDHRMEEGTVYEMLCETCGMPCKGQRDPQGRDMNDPDRTETAVCEFCDPQRW